MKNLNISLKTARRWYNSKDKHLKTEALKVFDEKELKYTFKDIEHLKDACEILDLNYTIILSKMNSIAEFSKASAATLALNIIKKAINLEKEINFIEEPNLWYPYNPIITDKCIFYRNEFWSENMEILGIVSVKDKKYKVVGGTASISVYQGLCNFDDRDNIGIADANVGFLGCANREIAEHFSRNFGLLITQAKYGDFPYFNIYKDFKHYT